MWAALFRAFRRGGASLPRYADSDFTFVAEVAQGGGPACVPDAFVETPVREPRSEMGNAPSTVTPSRTRSPSPAPSRPEEASASLPYDGGWGAEMQDDANPEGRAWTDAESGGATTVSSRSISELPSEDGDATPRQDVVSPAPPPSPSAAPCSTMDPVPPPGLAAEPHEERWPPYPTGQPPDHWQNAAQTWPPYPTGKAFAHWPNAMQTWPPGYSPLEQTYAAALAETPNSPECCACYYGGTYDRRAYSYARSAPWLDPAQYGGTWGPDWSQVHDYAGLHWHHLPGLEWNQMWEHENFGPWVRNPCTAVPLLYAPPLVWL